MATTPEIVSTTISKNSSDQFGPHPPSLLKTDEDLENLRNICRVPSSVEFALPTLDESPESGRSGYLCIYKVYLTGCGLSFPIPKVLVLFLHRLGLAFPQIAPNMLRVVLATLTVAAEAGYNLSVSDLFEMCSVRSTGKGSGFYTIYPYSDRALITGLPEKDEHWRESWLFVKINTASVHGLIDLLQCKWATSIVSQSRPVPWNGFLDFFSLVTEGDTIWNSFSLERIHKGADRVRAGKLRHVEAAPEPMPIDLMSYRERKDFEDKKKNAEKILKDQIDLVGRNHRDKVSALNDKSPGKTSLISGLSSHPTAISDFVPITAIDKEDDETIASLKRKRKTTEPTIPTNRKSRPCVNGQRTGSSAMCPPPPHDVSNQKALPVIDTPLKSRHYAPKNMAEFFRMMPNRFNVTMPTLDKWQPFCRDIYIKQSGSVMQEMTHFNDLICHYEQQLQEQSSLKEASKKDAETIDHLKKDRNKLEEKLSAVYSEQSDLKAEILKYKEQLHESSLKNSSMSSACKELKDKAKDLLSQGSKHIESLKRRYVLESDIKEVNSNIMLLEKTKKDEFDFDTEMAALNSSKQELKSAFDAFVLTPFPPQQFAAVFGDTALLPELQLNVQTEHVQLLFAEDFPDPAISSKKDATEDMPSVVVSANPIVHASELLSDPIVVNNRVTEVTPSTDVVNGTSKDSSTDDLL